MFEATVLGINVVIPSVIALAGALLAWLARPPRRDASGTSQTSAAESANRPGLATATNGPGAHGLAQAAAISACSVLAIWTAFALRNEWAWWHTDAWMRMPVAVAVVGLAAWVTAGMQVRWLAWSIRSVVVLTAAVAIFPTGEAWEFLLPRRSLWLASMTLSTLLGWTSMAWRKPQPAAVLGLSWILLLVGDAYLAGQSFLRVTEPLLAVASVLGCLSLLSLRAGSSPWVAIASGPCLFATSGFLASAQFNSFLGLPDSLTWFAMFCPALVAVATQWLTGHLGPGAQSKRYMVACVSISIALALAIGGWTTWLLPSGDEEW